MMKRTKLALIGVTVAGVVAAAAGIGVAAVGNDDQPLTGDAFDRAIAAALEETGGGDVLETEVGDDGAAYGVEIRTPAGRVVEVNLDEDFRVIGRAPEDDAGEVDDDVASEAGG